ncbi:MAG TPA: LutB/LldF family L-lactate oxidation iron-sulfur protein [Limnochordales bacterium]
MTNDAAGTPPTFARRAAAAVQDRRLREAVRVATERTVQLRRQAVDELAEMAQQGWAREGFEELRRQARAIKQAVVEHLDRFLEQACQAIEAAGGRVWHASDAAEVGRLAVQLARRHGVRLAVKSKSMATEEVHLNRALEQAGVQVVETDLGEFILQLAQDTPSHLVMPVMHKSRQEIAELFSRLAGRAVSTRTEELTAVAREYLREKFLAAEMGISGANFVVAETGTLVLVTNEGNGRMVTSLPRVHLAVVGVEKLVPRLEDLPVFLQLLARSATGQKLTVYTHLITGPRRPQEPDGPQELHVIFLDNGRRRLRSGPYREILHCIRCGACLNHCPVYQQVGGQTYGAVYSGPMGVVLTPQLLGMEGWWSLPAEACTLCGACTEVCPVGIPLHHLIALERRQMVANQMDRSGLGAPLRWAERAWRTGRGFSATVRLARGAWKLAARLGAGAPGPGPGRLWPEPLRRWARDRELPQPAPQSFRELWARELKDGPPVSPAATPAPGETEKAAGSTEPSPTAPRPPSPGPQQLRARLARELARLGAELQVAEEVEQAARHIARLAREGGRGDGSVVLWEDPWLASLGLRQALEQAGIVVHGPDAPRQALAAASVGVTGAVAAVAATGSVLLCSGPGQARSTSLLPWVHVAVVPQAALVATLEEAFARLPRPLPSSAVFVTGPSRSADIENDLSVGVHGPGRVSVVVMLGAGGDL